CRAHVGRRVRVASSPPSPTHRLAERRLAGRAERDSAPTLRGPVECHVGAAVAAALTAALPAPDLPAEREHSPAGGARADVAAHLPGPARGAVEALVVWRLGRAVAETPDVQVIVPSHQSYRCRSLQP